MGETGCGKTRLIRYMCDLAAQSGNAHSSTKKMNNMLILKVRISVFVLRLFDQFLFRYMVGSHQPILSKWLRKLRK